MRWAAIAALGLGGIVTAFHEHESQTRVEILRRVDSALERTPPSLAPTSLLLDWEPALPRVHGVEFHTRRRALLIGCDARELSDEAWLHELGHVRMQGSRPSGPLARRLLTAIEEGVADYYAAAISGTPRVAAEGEVRDLRRPPRLDDTDWMRLALTSFEPHRLGWALAAELYRSEARPGALLEDAVVCLDGQSALGRVPEDASAVVRTLLAECPERSRERLRQSFVAWMPSEISAPESSP